jgi:predicted Zn-ribbon and HTH transcriptional regulator
MAHVGAREIRPRAANETVRAALREALRGHPRTALELSAAVGIPHKQIDDHLEHLRRSGDALVVEPASCLACGFEFRDRSRTSRPSRCPKCKSERIDPPRFSLPE